ncbi:MAG: hypothetical protein J6B18_01975 [Bacteroidaceae bacterium]|nr:hypothetical protein [Bacteroidaceae bacterium]
MREILYVIFLMLSASCGNNNDYADNYRQMVNHYETGHELFTAGQFNESFEELYAAEELAIELNDNNFYALVQHHWNNFPDKYALKILKEEKLHLKSLEQELIAGNSKYLTAAVALFFILVTTLAIYLYLKKREHHEEAREQIETMQHDIARMQEKENEVHNISKRIFKERFATIDEICSDFYQRGDNYSDAEKGRRVSKIINHLKSKEALLQLEEIINKYNDNIITKLREQVPSIKEDEMSLVIYSYAELSNNTISFLTEKPASYIYSKRSKIKKKIINSGAKDCELFIRHLK